MKLREWYEYLKTDSAVEPIGVLLGVLQILRSGYIGRECTDNELYASCARWCEIYGPATAESVQKWSESLPTVFDMEIPDSVVAMAVGTVRKETEEKV